MMGKVVTAVFAGLGVSFVTLMAWIMIATIPDPPYAEIQGRAIYFMMNPKTILAVGIISLIMGIAGFTEYLTTLRYVKQTSENN